MWTATAKQYVNTSHNNAFTSTDSEGMTIILADGVARELEAGLTTTVSCVGNSIEIVLTGDIPADGPNPAVLINSLTTIIPTGNAVTMETNINIKVPAHGIEEDQYSMTNCQKR